MCRCVVQWDDGADAPLGTPEMSRLMRALILVTLLFAFVVPTLTAGEEPAVLNQGDYRVGGGDVLSIKVFGEEGLDREVRVSARGSISFPLIGSVDVGGRTAFEIADILTKRLAKDYLVNPQVMVTVEEFVSRQVRVLGAVKAPGMFNLTGPARISALLARAEGLTEDAGKYLLVIREGESRGQDTIRVDLGALLEDGATENDLPVQGGDILYVPRADEVYVIGEVAQPGPVSFKEGMSLLQAISRVGSFKSTASPSRVQIIRRLDGQESVIHADARKIQDGRRPDVPLQPEDLIVVPKSVF